jgi:hypothetical protein
MMPVCPELNCSPEKIYTDGCCKRCNMTGENMGKCSIFIYHHHQELV